MMMMMTEFGSNKNMDIKKVNIKIWMKKEYMLSFRDSADQIIKGQDMRRTRGFLSVNL